MPGEPGALSRLAGQLRRRNEIDATIACTIDRPMTAGHLGEWIAAQVFDIELEPSASAPAIDGRFRTGPQAGKSVNIKWYLKREGLLDVTSSAALDYYLVLSGPTSAASSSRGGTRPWQINAVYLFDARELRAQLLERGVKTGVATSVRKSQWEAAEIYPTQVNTALTVGSPQAALLALFGPE